ncbi:mitotic-spindle organizing protein 2A [Trichonephila clavipes]|nr:mitotic-spindle organizing protein 2A [Trichonephila clavipes]
MGRTILLERRQSESVGRRNSRTTFLRSDWPRPFARREVGVEMDWVDPKINDPRQGDLQFKFKRSHAKIGGRIQTTNRYECPKCGKNMVMRERKGTIDGYEWRCRTKGGENPHDSMNEFAVKDVRVNKNTVVDWYMFCREVCMAAILKESEPLGGEGKIVEIDESMFGKMNGAKSNERGNLSVIKEWVVPGSVIISDCWRAYNCLSHEGYQHLRVNHSLTFKDPETGTHTNSIEGTWSAIKRSLRNHAAHVEGQFDHYLAEYMWRRRRGHSLDDDIFRENSPCDHHIVPSHGERRSFVST